MNNSSTKSVALTAAAKAGRGFWTALKFTALAVAGVAGLAIYKWRERRYRKKAARQEHGYTGENRMRDFFNNAVTGVLLVGALLTGRGLAQAVSGARVVEKRIDGMAEIYNGSKAEDRPHYIFTEPKDFTDQAFGGSKFNTAALKKEEDKALKPGCTYEFTLSGTTLELWPPSYSRDIVSAKLKHCNAPK